jgi:PAS domain S-box-containing protein
MPWQEEAVAQTFGLLDSAGNRIVLLNRMAEQVFGYSREELLGQTVESLLPEALRDLHKKHRSEYVIHPVTQLD